MTLAFIPTRNHIETVKKRWDFQDEPKLIRNHQNAVFTVYRDHKPVILRFSDPAHRDLKELQAELEWISYLSDNGVGVATPIKSTRQSLVEELEDSGTKCFVSAFTKASGTPIDVTNMFSFSVLNNWGRELGRMHQLSMDFKPKTSRNVYSQHIRFKFKPISLNSKSNPMFIVIHQLQEWLEGLPQNPMVYGMIHGDSANFHIDSNQITFFDFDDCTFHWFAYDIANGLYSLLFDIERFQLNINFEECIKQFMNGYHKEKELSSLWTERISGFILYRAGLLYRWLLEPKTGPLWVSRIESQWKAFLLEWVENKLSGELNLP